MHFPTHQGVSLHPCLQQYAFRHVYRGTYAFTCFTSVSKQYSSFRYPSSFLSVWRCEVLSFLISLIFLIFLSQQSLLNSQGSLPSCVIFKQFLSLLTYKRFHIHTWFLFCLSSEFVKLKLFKFDWYLMLLLSVQY